MILCFIASKINDLSRELSLINFLGIDGGLVESGRVFWLVGTV